MGPIRHTEDFSKNFFEQSAWRENNVICGLDEVGRGCLAGPVVSAAVIVPAGTTYASLKDSKVLSEAERLVTAAWIKKHCLYSVGIIHHRLIDEQNIWHATLLAMKKALTHILSICSKQPSAVVVDAMPLDLGDTSYSGIPVHYFIKGESKSISIAAASILAKVARDDLMCRMATIFPGFSLQQHKGYATLIHKNAIVENKHTIIHRKTFGHVKIGAEMGKDEYCNQQTICGSNSELNS